MCQIFWPLQIGIGLSVSPCITVFSDLNEAKTFDLKAACVDMKSHTIHSKSLGLLHPERKRSVHLRNSAGLDLADVAGMVACFPSATRISVIKWHQSCTSRSAWAGLFAALQEGNQRRALRGGQPVLGLHLNHSAMLLDEDIQQLLESIPTLR